MKKDSDGTATCTNSSDPTGVREAAAEISQETQTLVFLLETGGKLVTAMKLKIAWIGRTKEPAIQSLAAEYSKRIGRYVPMESQEFASEAALLKWIEKATPRPHFVALDSHGKQFSSEELAEFIGNHQDRGTQAMLLAIGPPNGWSEEALKAAQFQLSMGKMTLPARAGTRRPAGTNLPRVHHSEGTPLPFWTLKSSHLPIYSSPHRWTDESMSR